MYKMVKYPGRIRMCHLSNRILIYFLFYRVTMIIPLYKVMNMQQQFSQKKMQNHQELLPRKQLMM